MGVTCCLRTSRERRSPSRTSKSPSCTFFYLPRTTMSWQSYVDDQLISTNMIKNAVIAGHDGNTWASSAGFNVTAAELKVILDRYSSTDQLAMNGVTVGGTKYMFLSANDRVVRARKGQSGVHCIKTVQALIVCVYEEPVVPEQAATVTEKLGVPQSTSATQSINIFYVFQ